MSNPDIYKYTKELLRRYNATPDEWENFYSIYDLDETKIYKQAPEYGEPWACGMDHKGRIIITQAKGKILCGWANRAEICVNACVGIPNEALNERFILEAVHEKFERMKQKHDEQKGTNHE